MPYRDSWLTCAECGKNFVFPVEEQRRLAREGKAVEPPGLCPDCRRKAERSRSPAPPPQRGGPLDEGPFEGTVKWYDPARAYGFITQENGKEIFFHRSGIAPGGPEQFKEGARVTYLIEDSPKGPQAVEVALMEDEG